jgi:sodium-dependent phosphate transporter
MFHVSVLGFDRIPLWGVFILAFGAGIVTAILVQMLFVPWQRGAIKSKLHSYL